VQKLTGTGIGAGGEGAVPLDGFLTQMMYVMHAGRVQATPPEKTITRYTPNP